MTETAKMVELPAGLTPLLDVDQAGAFLNISRSHVERLVKSGKILAYDYRPEGGSNALLRFRVEDLLAAGE